MQAIESVPRNTKTPSQNQADWLRRLVTDVTRLLNQADRFETACCGVTVGQCLTLTTLLERGALTAQQLGDALGVAPSTVTRAVAPLHARGWIARRRDETDRRQVWLSLTAEGTALAEQLDARTRTIYDTILQHIPAGQRTQALEGLELVVHACQALPAACDDVGAEPVALAATAAATEESHE